MSYDFGVRETEIVLVGIYDAENGMLVGLEKEGCDYRYMIIVRFQAKRKRERPSWKVQRGIRTFLLHGACLWGVWGFDILTARGQTALRVEFASEDEGLFLQVFDQDTGVEVIKASFDKGCT
jgi:hypothetical protein